MIPVIQVGLHRLMFVCQQPFFHLVLGRFALPGLGERSAELGRRSVGQQVESPLEQLRSFAVPGESLLGISRDMPVDAADVERSIASAASWCPLLRSVRYS